MFKEGCEDVEDDSRSQKLSMTRTEDNIDCVGQVVCGYSWLTVCMIKCELGINCVIDCKIITENLDT